MYLTRLRQEESLSTDDGPNGNKKDEVQSEANSGEEHDIMKHMH